MTASTPQDAIVEDPHAAAPEHPSETELQLRLRQQELLAELGVHALRGTTFQELLDVTVRLTAEGLRCEFCKIMELQRGQNRLLVRAGVGWDAGVVGTATVGADMQSPAGFALHTGKPVISNHLENEERFRTPELLLQHGIRRAANVILQGDDSAFGVLEVDSRAAGEFSKNDLSFLQGAANVLGMAIERQRVERELRVSLDRQSVLLEEMNHRVKNSLQLVANMLHLQAAGAEAEEVERSLKDAGKRVMMVARAHEHLYRSRDLLTIDLGSYLSDLCKSLENGIECSFDQAVAVRIEMTAERAIPVALIVNELVTNAAKHGYPDGVGKVWVTLNQDTTKGHAIVRVADAGIGLPPDFDLEGGKSLGMRIMRALSRQLGAALVVARRTQGAEFALYLPYTGNSAGR